MTLRLLGDQLEEARRVFEPRQAGRRGARPARAVRRASQRRDRPCGTDQPADCERAELGAATRAVHATIVLDMRLTTLGDVLLDVIVLLADPLVPGDDCPAETRAVAGGQAANVAAWAGALGADARFVGRRGDDAAGEIVTRALRANGVDVVGPVSGRTGVVVSIASQGDRTMASDRGSAPDLAPQDLDASWFDCDVLHLSGYALLREPISSAAVAAALLTRTHGGLVAVDVSTWSLVDEPFRERLRELAPDVVFATEREQEAVGELDARWVLKRGPNGLSVDGRDYPAAATTVVDATGAGDALAAGFLVGGPQLGLDAAARCCAQLGAMPAGAAQ